MPTGLLDLESGRWSPTDGKAFTVCSRVGAGALAAAGPAAARRRVICAVRVLEWL
jgi:hypothetical protein